MSFNLETPEFSTPSSPSSSCSSSSDTPLTSLYNKDYSLIYTSIEQFLHKCFDSLNRYIAFNNYGVGLQVDWLVRKINCLNDSFEGMDDCMMFNRKENNQKLSDGKTKAKRRYELQFAMAIDRMEELLRKFVELEVQFRKEYFGIKEHTNPILPPKPSFIKQFTVQSLPTTKLPTSINKPIPLQPQSPLIINPQNEQQRENELRMALEGKLQSNKKELKRECFIDRPLYDNLGKLGDKIDMMLLEIRDNKLREQGLVDMFMGNRRKEIKEEDNLTRLDHKPMINIDQTKQNGNGQTNNEDVSSRSLPGWGGKEPESPKKKNQTKLLELGDAFVNDLDRFWHEEVSPMSKRSKGNRVKHQVFGKYGKDNEQLL